MAKGRSRKARRASEQRALKEARAAPTPAAKAGPWSVRHAWILLGCLAALAAAIAFVYAPGLSGDLYFDDYRNIAQNRTLRITELSPDAIDGLRSGPSGDRVVSLFSFALHYYFGWTEPRHFRVVNIAIHILTAALVGLVARRLFSLSGFAAGKALAAALAVTTVWALHPIQLTSVTYVVQRMTSLAGLFFWMSYYLYLTVRMGSPREGWRRLLPYIAGAGALVCFWLGMLAKSHVAILPAIVVATEVLLFGTHRALDRRRIVAVAGIGLALLLLLVFTRGEQLEHFLRQLTVDLFRPISEIRGGTPFHRLISEPRVIFLYLSLFFVPVWHRFSLFWSFAPSQGLVSPLQTLPAILGLVGVGWLAFRWRRTRPLIAWGLACFLLGHVIEGTVIPLYLVFEHRMYLPSVFLLVALVALAEPYVSRIVLGDWKRVLAAGVAAALVLGFLSLNTHRRNELWAAPKGLYEHEIAHNPRNYQLKGNYAMFLLSGREGIDRDEAVGYTERLIGEIESLERTDQLEIRLKKLHSNLALHYIQVREELDKGLDHMLAAARYGYTPKILSRLASFYFYAKFNGNEEFLEKLVRHGYDNDERMLAFLETAYDKGLNDWSVTSNLISAYIYMVAKKGQPEYALRGERVLQENLRRYRADKRKSRALEGLAASLDRALRKPR